jgi:hypothetical protein
MAPDITRWPTVKLQILQLTLSIPINMVVVVMGSGLLTSATKAIVYDCDNQCLS